ncbi:hypothetical protein IT575_10295 [bacterium]|nr:hypothetical protein [bacterium]
MNRAVGLVVVSALLVLTLAMGSCGGNTIGFDPADGNAGFIGITEGGFKAVRYNDAGYQDSSLNSSMDLNVRHEGELTVVSVSIDDAASSIGVMLDLGYDPDKYTPVDVNFAGLVKDPLELALTNVAGVVGLGQVGNRTTAVYSGDFASVTFRRGAFPRTVSAAGGAYTLNGVDSQYPATANTAAQDGFVLTDNSTGDGDDATFDVYAIFAAGDGNSDSQTLVSDLATIGQLGIPSSISATDLVPAIGDYNWDGTVSVQDLTAIGLNFQRGYTGVEILLGDDATFDDTDAAVLTLEHANGNAPTSDYDTPTTDFNDIFRNWSGAITATQASAADVNADGEIFVSARVVDTNGPAASQRGPAFAGLSITVGPSIPALVVVADFDLQIVGATGGTGAGNDIFADSSEANVTANSSLTINITGISGAYDGQNFTPADAGTIIPQDVYDDALEAVQGLVSYSASNAGAAGCVFTSPVLSLAATSGTGVGALVFPDDDPESVDAAGEGNFTASVAAGGAGIPGDITKVVTIDVEADADAPLYTSLMTAEGQDGAGDWELSAAQNTLATAVFNFGAQGAPGTFDASTCVAELYDIDNGSATALTYADPVDDPGEFRVRDAGDPVFALEALISPSSLVPGHHYVLRFNPEPGNFNSANKPGEFFVLGALPPSTELMILPGTEISTATNEITLYYPNPKIRRNSRVIIDVDFSVDPQFPGAFSDVLKDDGDEFIWQAPADGGGPWPEITIVQAADATGIDASTVGIEGVFTLFTDSHTGYVGVDIAALPDPSPVESLTYSFKLFGKPLTPGDDSTRPEIGFGTFDINGLGVNDAPIAGVDFGINIFDGVGRGDLDFATADFSGKTLTLSTISDFNEAGTPDVLFVQWNGGRVAAPEDNFNVHLVATDQGGVIGSQTLDLEVRAVGLGLNGIDFLGTYQFGNIDKLSSGLGGIFAGGNNYDLVLEDGVAVDFSFANPLVVTE